MTTILYVGFAAAGVQIENGQWLERGEPTEVDTDLADRLLEQTANFVEADMSAATVADVLNAVGDDVARAEAALAAEQAKGDKARKSLIDKLEAIIAAGTGDEDA